MRKMAYLAFMAAIGIAARADVVTNVWIAPNGGEWFASENIVTTNVVEEVEYVTTNVFYTNWQDGANCISTNVAYFCLSNNATISSAKDTVPRTDGIIICAAELADGGGEEVADTGAILNR